MQDANTNYIKYLVDLSREGRKNSFMELCRLNIDSIYVLILHLVADVSLAVDLTIDVFISSWENLNHFRSDVVFNDWLKGIAVYMVLEEIRTKERQKRISKAANKPPTTQSSSSNKLEKMILTLDELPRIVFVLHDMEGYSCSEISDFLIGTTEKKIKIELKKTRKELMARL